MRPIAACAMAVVERTRVVRSHRNHPAFPTQWFTAYIALSPVHGLFGHRHPRKLPYANLTPASGRQDHATSPSASGALVRSIIRVHRIPPRARDDRETPLKWDGTVENIGLICDSVKQKYFCVRGLTAACTNGCLICPTGKNNAAARSGGASRRRTDRRLAAPQF